MSETNKHSIETISDKSTRSRKDDQALGKIVLTQTEIDEFAERHLQQIKNISKGIRDTELQFAERKRKKEKEDGSPMSEKEFIAWEDDLAFSLSLQQKEIESLRKYRPGFAYKTAEVAKATDPMIAYSGINNPEVANTIEAQAGRFYDERRSALLKAITNSDRPEEEKQEDRHYILGFWQLVAAHLDYKHQSNAFSDPSEGWSYDRSRTKAHDAVVNGLNKLNDLAEKYGTRRFTVRNFWDSTKRIKSSPETIDRARYDRDIVEEYYAIAFKYDINQELARLEREQGWTGIYR